jgi:uncharacterized membrane protein (TIGR02234 family)
MLISLAALAFLTGLVALACSQPWFTVRLADVDLTVRGDVAAGALPPLALASLALVASLAITGPLFRAVLAVIESFLGLCVSLVAVVAVSDPAAASASLISSMTGVTVGSAGARVESFDVSAWPFLAVATGLLVIALGVMILATHRLWPTYGRKYSRYRLESTDPEDKWDALSEGEDPTSRGLP